MGKLEGKVAIITGGAQGMGETHARLFLNEGAKVVITDILADKGQALAKELGENVKFIKHDVTSESEWEKVVTETESTFGPVNILVNNAGVVLNKFTADIAEEEFRRVVDINQVGVFLGMKTVFPSMRKTKEGSIVNVSSISGLTGSMGSLAYTASKFAVTGMTKTAAIDFAEYGIRVNSVHPGTIRTPILGVAGAGEGAEKFLEFTPLKRIAEPEEVSKLVLFLASNDSSFSTGSEFVADGGVTAGM